MGLIGSFIGRPGGANARERQIIQKGIQRSLSDLDDEIWRLTMSAMDTKGQDENFRREIGRLEEMRENLTRAEKDLKDDHQEEWIRVRDTALGTLEEARKYFRNAQSGEFAREA